MTIEQMSTGYKRILQRSHLKLAILLLFAPFLVILMTQQALAQVLKTQLNAPGNATGTFPFGVNTSEAVVGSYVNSVRGHVGIYIYRWQIYDSRLPGIGQFFPRQRHQ